MPQTPRILFLCTGNSCRSQMAEALLRHLGGDRFVSCSAGSHPAGYIHPLAEECLQRMGVPMLGQSSKSWNEFTEERVDAAITLCDSAAAEACPLFPGGVLHPLGGPIRAHWSLADPTYFPGTDGERLEFAMRIAVRLRTKVQGLVDLDWTQDRAELQRRLEFLGEI